VPQVKIRRRSGRQRNSLTAAAQRVDAGNSSTFRKSMTTGDDWQADAWRYLQAVGEFQYFVSWRSWSASRCRLVASAMDEQGEPTGGIPDDDPLAAEIRKIVNDIASGITGQAKLVRRTAYLLSVVGECWIGMVVRDPSREEVPGGQPLPTDLNRPGFQREQWYVFGKDQIAASSQEIQLKLPDGTKHTFDPNIDILFRVWDEHPKDPSLPISPAWSTLDALNEIVQATATIDQANNSRLIGNGLLFVPQEMSLPNPQAPVARPVGSPDINVPVPTFLPNSSQQLQDMLYDVASTAKKDQNSMAAMLPIVAGVPGELIKSVQWLRPSTEVPETAIKTRNDAIRRLAMGLDVAPERLLGVSEGNHWSAWAIDEQDIKIHVAPVVELICNAITQEVLRQKLAELGIDPDAYLVWYDTTALTQDPDKTEEAKDSFDRGAINARALREHLGFDDADGYDLETREGWLQLAMDKIAADPAANAPVFGPILEKLLDSFQFELGTPAPAAIAPQADADEDAPADSEPEEPADDPADADPPEVTAAAGVTIARLCVNRALELANKRRRTRTNASLFRDIAIERAHTILEPVEMAAVPDLIKGWDTGVDDADLCQLGLNASAFRSAVYGVAAIALATSSDPVVTNSMLRRL
jgi:hypothetical protein